MDNCPILPWVHCSSFSVTIDLLVPYQVIGVWRMVFSKQSHGCAIYKEIQIKNIKMQKNMEKGVEICSTGGLDATLLPNILWL